MDYKQILIVSNLNLNREIGKENEINQQEQMKDLGCYIQPWFKIGYYILIVPFRVEQNGKSYIIKENRFQKVNGLILYLQANYYFFYIRIR